MPYGGQIDYSRSSVFEFALNVDSAGKCDDAIRLASSFEDAFLVFGVGYKIPNLAETTVSYLSKRWPREKLLHNPKGYTTWTETEAIIEELKKRGTKSAVVVTSWYHMPRTWLIWQILKKRMELECKIKFHSSWRTSIFRLPFSLLWEIAGFAKLFLQLAAEPQNALKPQT